jgi:protein SCO1/2/putative membrane protein
MMLFAFAVSVAFLASYLTYHGGLKHYTGVGHKPYSGDPSLQGVYRGLLVTHIILAAAVPVLAIITIRRGLKQQWESHRKIAKITFPIWLYVSVTGVVIYFMN